MKRLPVFLATFARWIIYIGAFAVGAGFFGALLALGACSQGASVTQAPSPAAQVYAVENTYAAALVLAVQYGNLPRCGVMPLAPVSDVVRPCSSASAVETMRSANVQARRILDTAQAAVQANPAGATQAIADATQAAKDFQTVVAQYAGKGS